MEELNNLKMMINLKYDKAILKELNSRLNSLKISYFSFKDSKYVDNFNRFMRGTALTIFTRYRFGSIEPRLLSTLLFIILIFEWV